MQWSCTLCSYNNDESACICLICDAPRSSIHEKACEVCTFLNSADVSSCDMCGSVFKNMNLKKTRKRKAENEVVVEERRVCLEKMGDIFKESEVCLDVDEFDQPDFTVQQLSFDTQDEMYVPHDANIGHDGIEEEPKQTMSSSLSQNVQLSTVEYIPYVPYNAEQKEKNVQSGIDSSVLISSSKSFKTPQSYAPVTVAPMTTVSAASTASSATKTAIRTTSSTNPATSFTVELSQHIRSNYDLILDPKLTQQPTTTSHQGILLSAFSIDLQLVAKMSIHVHAVDAVERVESASTLYDGIDACTRLVIVLVKEEDITHKFIAREKVLGLRSVEHQAHLFLPDALNNNTLYYFVQPTKAYRQLEMVSKAFVRHWERPEDAALIELTPVHNTLKETTSKIFVQVPHVSPSTALTLASYFPSLAVLVRELRAHADVKGTLPKPHRHEGAHATRFDNMTYFLASIPTTANRSIGPMVAKNIVATFKDALM